MAISSKKIANALISSIRGGSNIEDLSKSFKNFMEINHLSPLLPSVLKNLERELSEIQNKKTAIIKTSHSVKEASIKSIEEFIKKENNDPVRLEVDESLIGGFQATYKGTIYDGSVKNYLKDLRVNLMK
jgi:F0F1-type ATP synthase delta subunit